MSVQIQHYNQSSVNIKVPLSLECTVGVKITSGIQNIIASETTRQSYIMLSTLLHLSQGREKNIKWEIVARIVNGIVWFWI